MKAIFKTFFLSLCIIANTHFAYSQTASILPPAKTTFNDQNGKPLTSGTVEFFIPNTSTHKTTWKDAAETIPNLNPVVLDAAGRALILGSGDYRQVVKDRLGNLIWDQVTSSTGNSSTGPTATGDGDLVGTVKPWAGLTAPNQYVLTYGQELSRTTYSALFTAITSTQSTFCTSGSPIITGLSSTINFWIGMQVELPCVVSGNTTIIAKTSGSVTLATNANVTTNAIAIFFPWGGGNHTTTFNVPDYRGFVLAGNNNMGGVAAVGRLTTAFYPTDPNSSGASGGRQSVSLSTPNLPAQTIPSQTLVVTNGQVKIGGSSSLTYGTNNGVTYAPNAGSNAGAVNQTQSITQDASTAAFPATTLAGQTAVAIPTVQPTITANYIIKVLPDANSATANGVTDINGMTGSIGCGPRLTCTGNIINVDLSNFHPNTAIYATDYGMSCDGVNGTDQSQHLQDAIFAANGGTSSTPGPGYTVIVPGGQCRLNTTVYLNQWNSPGVLTVQGMHLLGQGENTTILDSHVANGYGIAINPDWRAAFVAQNGLLASTSGTLASNTYYIQTTVTDNAGNEIFVTLPKSAIVTGPTGSVTMILPVLNIGYTYNIYLGTATQPINYASISGSNAINVAGNQTVILTAIGSAHAVPTDKLATWQNAKISNMHLTNTSAPANSSGYLCFKCGYSDVDYVYFSGFTANGMDVPNYIGDLDGSFVVTVNNSKFDTISGWGIYAIGNALELSNFSVLNSNFNLTGSLPAVYVDPSNYLTAGFTITSITNSTTSVVTTSVSHSLVTNDQVYISGVAGMTLANGYYRVNVLSANTYNLKTTAGAFVDTTSLGSYTASSGKSSLAFRPPTNLTGISNVIGTGGVGWLGLGSTFRNSSCTQVKNTCLYFSEVGSSDNATVENFTFENTYGKGLYAASLNGGTVLNSECLSNQTLQIGSTNSCVQAGTGFGAGGVQNFQIQNMKVRSDVSFANGFEQFPNINNSPSLPATDTVRVQGITWQNFVGNFRFVGGFTFNPIPGQVKFSVSALNTFKLAPIGYGCSLPLHLVAGGEWVQYCVPDAGLTFAVSTSAINTTYNVYAYNTASALSPYVLGIAVDTTPPIFRQGFAVQSTDTAKTFVGTITTDGSGNFQVAGAQTSQYPPNVAGGGGGTPGGSNTQVQYNNSGSFAGITGATTNGIALTLVAPVLGTPASGVATNLTGTATGLTAGTATNATNVAITDDNSTNATMFPTWVTANTGNLPSKTSSSKWTWNPSTGVMTFPSLTLSSVVLTVPNGGTGLATLALGDFPCGNGTSAFTAIHTSAGSGSLPLVSNGATTCPTYQAISINAISGFGTGVTTAAATTVSTAGGFPIIVAKGTIALGTTLITAGACGAAATSAGSGIATTDVIDVGFNGDPTAVTGYTPTAMLSIVVYPTANTVNIKQCNLTGSSITPSALTLNWAVRK